MIETSGERFVGRLPKDLVKIVDGEMPGFRRAQYLRFAQSCRVGSQGRGTVCDFQPPGLRVRPGSHAHRLTERVNQVVFSPVSEDPQGKWQGLQPRQLVGMDSGRRLERAPGFAVA